MRRSILIGLGGMGCEVLTDVRRRIVDQYGSLEALPWVRFLAIDTSRDTFDAQPDEPEVRWRPPEFALVRVTDLRRMADGLDRFPHIASWLDPALAHLLSANRGLMPVRALGRLALFADCDHLRHRLQQTVVDLMSESWAGRARGGDYMEVAPGLSLYAAASLFGGTGSGMLIDVGYLFRKLIEDYHVNQARSIGFFILPSPHGQHNSHAPSNAYAALTELNHYSCSDTEFVAQYGPGEPELRTMRSPFDVCYLLQPGEGQAALNAERELVPRAGHRIFLEVATSAGEMMAAHRVNLHDSLLLGSPSTPACYGSSGVSSLGLPRHRLIRACALRLAHQVVRQWGQAQEPGASGEARTPIEARMRDEALDPESVLRAILRVDTGDSVDLRHKLRDWRPSADVRASSAADPGWVDHLETEARRIAQQLRAPAIAGDVLHAPPEQTGEYAQQMVANAHSCIETGTDALRGMAARAMRSASVSELAVTELLDESAQYFRSVHDRLAERLSRVDARLPELAHQMQDVLEAAQRVLGSPFTKLLPWQRVAAAKTAIEAIRGYEQCLAEQLSIRLALRVYEAMLAGVENLREPSRLWHSSLDQLDARLTALEERLARDRFSIDADARSVDGLVESHVARVVEAERAHGLTERIASAIGLDDGTVGFREADVGDLLRSLLKAAGEYFQDLEAASLLETTLGQYADRDLTRVVQRMFADARPAIRLSELPLPGYPVGRPAAYCFVGLPDRRSAASLHGVLTAHSEQWAAVAGAEQVGIVEMPDAQQVFVVQDCLGFGLQLIDDLDRYRGAYENRTPSEPALYSPHTRRDVKWRPIEAAPPRREGPRDPRQIPSVAELQVGELLLKISTGSLVDLNVDAIACSRSRSLRDGEASPKSVHGAIQRAGGMEITREAAQYGPISQGTVVVTGAGSLPADHVIHVGIIDNLTHAPVTEEVILRATGGILDECERRQWSSVGLPLMGTRAAGLTQDRCAEAMFEEVCRRARAGATHPQVVVFSLLGREGLARLVTRFTEAKARTPAEASEPERPLVFISAKSEDYEHAERLYRHLLDRGISAFFSRESLPQMGDADYRRAIDEVLDTARHMIVVTSSREHVRSPWVEAEWGFFVNEMRSGRKTGNLVTLTVGLLREEDLPPSLRMFEVMPFGPEALDRVLQYLQR